MLALCTGSVYLLCVLVPCTKPPDLAKLGAMAYGRKGDEHQESKFGLRAYRGDVKKGHPRSASELTEPRATSKTRIKTRIPRLRSQGRLLKLVSKVRHGLIEAKGEFQSKKIF